MDFNLLTLAELKSLAKEENIKGVSGLKKDELIVILEENEKKKKPGRKAAVKDAEKPVKAASKAKKEKADESASKPEEDAAEKPGKATSKAKGAGKKETVVKASKTAKAPAEEEKEPAEEVKKSAKAVKASAKEAKASAKEAKASAKEEKAPAEEIKTPVEEVKTPSEPRVVRSAPIRTYDSQVPRRDATNPRQTPIRRDGNAPVRGQRPVPGVRPVVSDMRPAPVARPIGPDQRPAPVARPIGPDQRPAVAARPADQRVGQIGDRAPFAVDGASHAETLAAYIAQNYALAGSPQDSGETKEGILEVMPEGFAFVRCDNFLPGSEDVYVSPAQVKRYGLKTGDYIVGNTKVRMPNEKFSALLYINTVNKLPLEEIVKRKKFEDLTPVFPNQRFHLETPGCGPAMRMVDLLSPIGRGQRGMIVSQPKAGKTTLLKQIAKALIRNHPSIHLIILLIDERPEEVTDMKESINGDNVEVIYSTFDEQPENHKRVSEMVIERARRLVEQKQDVVILLDSITRLARAYNLTVQASGRTLSGGLDPAALYMPKKFFGAARCMREGGSLTVLATALVDTGSRMDDVVFEEFKGTGNMELVLDRNLSERRVFPAIDLPKSGTRREDLLLTPQELEASNIIRRAFNSSHTEEVVERIINLFTHTRNNQEFVEMIKKTRIVP